jgi:hypothetical protein
MGLLCMCLCSRSDSNLIPLITFVRASNTTSSICWIWFTVTKNTILRSIVDHASIMPRSPLYFPPIEWYKRFNCVERKTLKRSLHLSKPISARHYENRCCKEQKAKSLSHRSSLSTYECANWHSACRHFGGILEKSLQIPIIVNTFEKRGRFNRVKMG